MKASVLKVSISEKKGTTKHNVPSINLIVDHGVENDAHAGPGKRQVSLLAIESIETMNASDMNLNPGDFAENITTKNIDLPALPIGTRLKIGDVVLEVSQIGKECHTKCEIFEKVGSCIMPTEGIFAKVVTGGTIKENDNIEVEKI